MTDFFNSLRMKSNDLVRTLKIYFRRLRAYPLSFVGVIIILFFVAIALLTPVLAPPTSENPYIMPYYGWHSKTILFPSTLPGPEHPFGLLHGFDLYYGCIWGVRVAFYISIITTLIALSIGLCIGSIAGYFEGLLDEVLMRFTDAFFALPGLIYVLLVVAAMPLEWAFNLGIVTFKITLLSMDRIILALAIIGWPSYARLIRGEIKKVKHQDYVEAAKAIGCSRLRVLIKHILPNSISPVLALAFLNIGGVLLAASTVSFLGFGPERGFAEWGSILATSTNDLIFITEETSQYVILYFMPALFLSTFVLGWSLLGDALINVIDPTLERRFYF